MKKVNIVLLVAVLVVGLCCGGTLWVRAAQLPAEVTVLQALSQTEPFVPEWAKPAEAVEVDFGENLALTATLTASSLTQTYKPGNANDGSLMTYWEAKEFPADLTAELAEASEVHHIVIRLNPNAIWGARRQNIEVQLSVDGTDYKTVVSAADYVFDPETANTVVIEILAEIAPQAVGFVRLVFHANTGATGGQAAEFEIYAE